MTHRPLLEWIQQPSSKRGIHFAARNGDWIFWSYARLADLARRAARGFFRARLREDDVVALIQNSSPEFIASLFGAMLVGGVPAPMPPPETFQATQDYWQRAHGLLQLAQPALVVTGADPPASLRDFLLEANWSNTITVDKLLREEAETIESSQRSAELALLQFTSGSSGNCRAVRVPFAGLEANLATIHQWLEWTEFDTAVSWLPVHHDMGLIGCVISALVCQCDLWLLDPEQFVRSPLRYLRCFAEKGARLTAMPNFGLDHIVRRVRPEMLTGLDFSALRGVIVGSELLKAEDFARFYNLLAPFGFQRTSLLPAYGLAEATLAVTGLPLSEGWKQIEIDPESVCLGGSVARWDKQIPGGAQSIGCGRPLAGVSVTIENESNHKLPDGQVGQIVVRGNTVAAGYHRGVVAADTCFKDGSLYTGDIGFVQEGQLFVLGRLGDSMKVRGKAVFAEDVESAVARLGIPSKRVVALLGSQKGEPTAVVLLERPATNYISQVHSILRSQVEGAALFVLEVPRGTIRRTSSGKLRRRELWRRFCEGAIRIE